MQGRFKKQDYDHIPEIFYNIRNIDTQIVFYETLGLEEKQFLLHESKPDIYTTMVDEEKFVVHNDQTWLHWLAKQGKFDTLFFIIKCFAVDLKTSKDQMDMLISTNAKPIDGGAERPFLSLVGDVITEDHAIGFSPNIYNKVIKLFVDHQILSNKAWNQQIVERARYDKTVLQRIALSVASDVFIKILETLEPKVLSEAICMLDNDKETGFVTVCSRHDFLCISHIINNASPFKLLMSIKDREAFNALIDNNKHLLQAQQNHLKIKFSKIYKSIKDPEKEITKRPEEFIKFVSHYLKNVKTEKVTDFDKWMSLLEKSVKGCKEAKFKDQLNVLLSRVYFNICYLSQSVYNPLLIKAFQALYAVSKLENLDLMDNAFLGLMLARKFSTPNQIDILPDDRRLAFSLADNMYAIREKGLIALKSCIEAKIEEHPSIPIIEFPVILNSDCKDSSESLLVIEDAKHVTFEDEIKPGDLKAMQEEVKKSLITYISPSVSAEGLDETVLFYRAVAESHRKSEKLINADWKSISLQIEKLHQEAKLETTQRSFLNNFASLKLKYELADDKERQGAYANLESNLFAELNSQKKSGLNMFSNTFYSSWLNKTLILVKEAHAKIQLNNQQALTLK